MGSPELKIAISSYLDYLSLPLFKNANALLFRKIICISFEPTLYYNAIEKTWIAYEYFAYRNSEHPILLYIYIIFYE